jgi:hypothetical protein
MLENIFVLHTTQLNYILKDQFVQTAIIGYNYGSFF